MRANIAPYCNLLLVRALPFLRWWPMVSPRTLRADAMAGLTNAFVVLPQGVAFALIAGLPPVYGLYSAMVPPIIAALFGSSRHLISGPTTAISIVVFAAVSKVAEPGSAEFVRLALTLTLLAGLYQLVLGLVRMGALVNFISHSVVVGFTAGAAVLIATSQIKHYLGVSIPAGESFLETWVDLYHQATVINPYVTGVATLTLVVAVAFMKWRPRWPGMLIAMVAGSALALALGGDQHGIGLVGEIPRQLPPLSAPDFSLKAIKNMGGAALAIAMLGLVEAVSIARSIASRSGQRIDGNQEFIGQGMANVVGSFFSSYASSGSFTRSGLNYATGAVTPMSAVFAALSLAAIVLLIAPYAAYLPKAAMAGILLVVAYRLIDVHHIRTILRASRRESAVLITTFLATLFVELEFAIYVGVLLSLVFYLLRTSKPRIVVRVPDPQDSERRFVSGRSLPECPQLRIVRIDGSLFFGAVDHVQQTLQAMVEADPERKHILVIGDGINFIDIAGAEMLAQEAKRLRDMGGGLYIAKVKDEACGTLKRGGYAEQFGYENIFASKSEAIAAIFQRLNSDKCARCTRRIFEECQAVDSAPDDTAAVSRTTNE
jgi:SulP family sulfate permease